MRAIVLVARRGSGFGSFGTGSWMRRGDGVSSHQSVKTWKAAHARAQRRRSVKAPSGMVYLRVGPTAPTSPDCLPRQASLYSCDRRLARSPRCCLGLHDKGRGTALLLGRPK